MPYIYIHAKDEFEVVLPEPDFMSDWESAEAEHDCDSYDHPKVTINLKIEDRNDSISPARIYVADKDAIEGGISVKKLDGKTWRFSIAGKFKSSVHKSGINLINSGARPVVDGVTRFRQEFAFDDARDVAWEISLKPIK